eukprot:TRINITY_DN649_c1_g1_i4.p1 TRINITY_DN649_c1_g1~~TRINITY_DN649_c1_g1_i4.p1  ORF type:complete len:309 (-),score=112.98 TRINITY_DN649_c1_g1_i4:17-943(-)
MPLDPGNVYASKSFFDYSTGRQILWSWVQEDDNQYQSRGWAGMQSLPKVLTIDRELNWLVQTPAHELQLLRKYPGTRYEYPFVGTKSLGIQSNQVEIKLNFEYDLEAVSQEFGILVKQSPDEKHVTKISVMSLNLSTPFYNFDLPGADYRDFNYDLNSTDATNVKNCSQTCDTEMECVTWTYVKKGDPVYPRCSLKSGIPKLHPNSYCISGTKNSDRVFTVGVIRENSGTDGASGNQVAILPMGKKHKTSVELNVFVDHSVVEVFADEGRAVITSRVYVPETYNGIGVYASNAMDMRGWVYEMESCWQ